MIGIATVGITVIPHISWGSGAPRAVYLRFPMGNPLGEPFDVPFQKRIVVDALNFLVSATAPRSVLTLPYLWRRKPEEV
jgi:D-proline reductase (dithiol) PrdB